MSSSRPQLLDIDCSRISTTACRDATFLLDCEWAKGGIIDALMGRFGNNPEIRKITIATLHLLQHEFREREEEADDEDLLPLIREEKEDLLDVLEDARELTRKHREYSRMAARQDGPRRPGWYLDPDNGCYYMVE